jgi:hypothetical protein
MSQTPLPTIIATPKSLLIAAKNRNFPRLIDMAPAGLANTALATLNQIATVARAS